MNPPPAAALQQRCDALAAAQWPSLADKLGDRREAFIAAVHRQAAKYGLDDADAASRYLSLCFAFGPAFEEKPDNEWALAVLADERLAPWAKLHQLVLRADQTLQRRGADPRPLRSADAALLDGLDAQRRAADADAPALARCACDVEALALRLLDHDWRHEYRLVDGAWQRLSGPPPVPALRIDAQHPAPARISVLSLPADEGVGARLQLGQILLGGCDGDHHPAVRWRDRAGIQLWRGHAARALSWPVHARSAQPPDNGLGVALVEESAAELQLLETETCGLRDAGVPLGGLALQVYSYLAQQWLWILQRSASTPLQWPPVAAGVAAAPSTRCRIECDGTAVDPAAWQRGFDEDLPRALQQGLDPLFDAWSRSARQTTLHATPGLLSGRAALTWGWREAPAGLAGAPLMRLLAEIDLACDFALSLEGEVELGGSLARVRLSASGQGVLQHSVARERPEPALLASLLPVTLRWRAPFTLDYDPIASADAVTWCDAGPCSGAMVLEAGLRPRVAGGSGWQWFVRLAIEPVLAPVTVHDPALGQTRRTLALLPALPLLDWSLG